MDKGYRDTPHDAEAEQRVVASLLAFPENIVECHKFGLNEEHFHVRANIILFRALLELDECCAPLELANIADMLERRQALRTIGGLSFLERLYSLKIAPRQIRSDMRILRNKLLLRRILGSVSVVDSTAGETSAQVSEGLLRSVQELCSLVSSDGGVPETKNQVMDVIESIERRYESHRNRYPQWCPGLPSGFPTLDRVTGGLRPGQFVIVTGTPRAGKTAFAIEIARYVGVKCRVPVTYFTSDLCPTSIIERMLSTESRIEGLRLAEGSVDIAPAFRQLTTGAYAVADAPLRVCDSSRLNVWEIWTKARSKEEQDCPRLIVIDSLGGLTLRDKSTDTRRDPVAPAKLRILKAMAEDLQIPVILLSKIRLDADDSVSALGKWLDSEQAEVFRSCADVVLSLARPYPSARATERLEMLVQLKGIGPIGCLSLMFNAGTGNISSVAVPLGPVPPPLPSRR